MARVLPQDPVNPWKAGPGEVMTVENLIILFVFYNIKNNIKQYTYTIYYIGISRNPVGMICIYSIEQLVATSRASPSK